MDFNIKGVKYKDYTCNLSKGIKVLKLIEICISSNNTSTDLEIKNLSENVKTCS
jgi:hypothetical protein